MFGRFSAFFCLTLMVCSPSHSEDYFLISSGQTSFDGSEKILGRYGITEVNGLQVDDSANGIGFAFGRELSNGKVFEIAYRETGQMSISAPVGATFTRGENDVKTITDHSELKASAYSLGVAGLLPIFGNERMDISARISVDYFEAEIEAIYGTKTLGGLKHGDAEGFALNYGLQASFGLTEELFFKVQYDLYGFDVMDDYQLETVSLGFGSEF